MKRLTIILAFLSANLYSQAYVDLSLDPNKIFGTFDNKRTIVDHKGIDFDIEVGAKYKSFSAFLYYGAFFAADYQNYGTGAEYYFIDSDRFDASFGSSISVVLRKLLTGAYYEQESWAGFMGWNARITGIYWLHESVGVSGRLQYQRRPDIKCKGIIEGNVGLRIIID